MNDLLHNKPHFYKYCSSDSIKKIIENKSMKWSSPHIFNDPFDFQTEFKFNFEIEDLKKRFCEEIENIVYGENPVEGDITNPLYAVLMHTRAIRERFPKEEFLNLMKEAADESEANATSTLEISKKWWEEFRGKFRVYCVSENIDDLLMWAHYADCHRGGVIKQKCIIEKDRAICAAVPVDYRDNLPTIADLEEYVKHLTGQKELDFGKTFTKLATTKSTHWSYENEWRCLGWDSLNDGSEFEFVNILPEEIEAIYLGCKMNEDTQTEIHNMLTGEFSHVELWKARKHDTRYGLEFERIG